MAAECTTAIIASIFGTIGVLLLIAAIVALAWYCYRRRQAGKKLLTVMLLTRLCKTLFILPPILKGAAHIIHFVFTASFASTSSADSVSDPEFSFGGKAKGGDIGLDGSGTPVTFSHHYSEKAPSVGKKLQIQATQYTITNKTFL